MGNRLGGFHDAGPLGGQPHKAALVGVKVHPNSVLEVGGPRDGGPAVLVLLFAEHGQHELQQGRSKVKIHHARNP